MNAFFVHVHVRVRVAWLHVSVRVVLLGHLHVASVFVHMHLRGVCVSDRRDCLLCLHVCDVRVSALVCWCHVGIFDIVCDWGEGLWLWNTNLGQTNNNAKRTHTAHHIPWYIQRLQRYT